MTEPCRTTRRFAFETAATDQDLIPLAVRFRLDLCGLRLTLAQWRRLSAADRAELLDAPCATAAEIVSYARLLKRLGKERLGERVAALAVEPTPAWFDAGAVPAEVAAAAAELGQRVSPAQWASLTRFERFVLVKLGRSRERRRDFAAALSEVGLSPRAA
jgi:hypothetical protein